LQILLFLSETKSCISGDITENFSTIGYNDEQISISQLLANRPEWLDEFMLDLTEYEEVPNASVFKVNVYLESGFKLVTQTEQINFNENTPNKTQKPLNEWPCESRR